MCGLMGWVAALPFSPPLIPSEIPGGVVSDKDHFNLERFKSNSTLPCAVLGDQLRFC